MEKKYIKPLIIQANKVAGINEYLNKPEYTEPSKKCEYKRINFEDIPNYHRLIVLGEPGCGKTELTRQLTSQPDSCKISLLENTKSDIVIEYGTTLICFDALDEVSIAEFSSAIKLIAQTAQNHPTIRIIVTCRTHYINSNISLILASLSDFQFLLIDKFDEDKIKAYIDSTDLNESLKQMLQSKLNSDSNKQLQKILQIPRYLTELCTVIKESKISPDELESWKRADFFEKAIYNKLESELTKEKDIKSTNELHISQRMLEKLALIMEIKRENRISVDDFLSFVDETDSNISHVFLSTINLSKFYYRTLKKTGNYLEFDNTEFQEYLAAKEILRHSNKYQIIYDLLVDKDFEHIYSNWYDVLRFIVELSPDILLPLSKYIMLANNSWTDEEFFRLVKEVNPEKLNNNQKAQLFETIYTYFQSHGLFLQYDHYQLLLSLYTQESSRFFDQIIEEYERVDYHFRVHNQFLLVTLLIRNKFLTNKIEYWTNILKEFAVNDSTQIQCSALYAIMDLELEDCLSSLNNSIQITSREAVYKTYMMALYHVCPNNDFSISHFKIGLKKKFTEGINGLLHITEPVKFISTFTDIFNSEDLTKLLFDEDSHPWGYTIFSNTVRELWDNHPEIEIMVKQFFKFIFEDEDDTVIYSARELILELLSISKLKDRSFIFHLIELCRDLWILDDKIWMLQEIVETDQIEDIKKSIDNRQSNYSGEEILKSLLYGLKFKSGIKNPNKEKIYMEGKNLFPELYKTWEMPQKEQEDPKKNKFKQILKDELSLIEINNIENAFKYFSLFNRHKGDRFIDVLTVEEKKTLQEVIIYVLDYIDFSNISIIKTAENTFTVSKLIIHFHNALNIALGLQLTNLLIEQYRKKIIFFMPIGFNQFGHDYNKTQQYFSLITELNPSEINELYSFLMNREDNYVDYNIISFFEFIRRFKLVTLSDFVKKCILQNSNDYYKKEGLQLLAEDFMLPSENFFLEFISSNESEEVVIGDSYDTANAILIKLFNNKTAAHWRFEYLRRNYISCFITNDDNQNNDVDIHYLSDIENEIRFPTILNCFIEGKKPDYIEQFFELIDFSLTLNTKHIYKTFCEYIQSMSIQYFKAIDNRENVIELRKRTNNHQNKKAAEEFRRLLKELELFYVNKETNINIYQAISQYNKIKANKYEMISNSTDLYEVVQRAINDFVNTIENEGLYRPINYLSSSKYPNEDLLQKTLKLSLENSLYKYGVREIDIIREANLYDDKRTDIIVKYGFIGPIMIELKLLDNTEVQNKTEMVEYKKKLNQYIQGNHCDYSFYLIFQRKQTGAKAFENFQSMKYEYQDINNLTISFINCYIDDLYKSEGYQVSNPRKIKTKD